MLIRLMLEKREKEILSPYASLSAKTSGRQHAEKECDLRTAFQRDRDKIIHCKAFRRLKHKTQVFISPAEDHYRTRLTHTLEVAQIARTIARALKLNEDLAEAIALGHDLGHTPFGHSGEEVLDEIMHINFKKNFRHAEQSLRVVEVLEKHGKGLNLTDEVRDGILHHPQKDPVQPRTLEGKIVRLADHIAYINHDIQDSVLAGILKKKDLPQKALKILDPNLIDTMVKDVILNSIDKPEIKMSKKIEGAMNKLYDFLFKNVYTNPEAKSEEGKTDNLIHKLFAYYLNHPEEIIANGKNMPEDELVEHIVDFIANMTDRYAINKFEELFVPNEWKSR